MIDEAASAMRKLLEDMDRRLGKKDRRIRRKLGEPVQHDFGDDEPTRPSLPMIRPALPSG